MAAMSLRSTTEEISKNDFIKTRAGVSLTSNGKKAVVAGYERRMETEIVHPIFRCNLTDRGKAELVAALTEIIKHDDDRIMIVDLGPLDGRAEERIEFLGVRPSQMESKAVVV
ncbi:MAG: hypothetical protein WAW52_07545 [Methanothrix sp.]|jgi:hypothetical protein